MDAYLPLLVMLALAALFVALSFFASNLLGPKNTNPAKTAFYECGIIPVHETAERFPVKFSMVAMAFIIFDVEIVFLYPWAVTLSDTATFGLVAMGAFAVPFVVSFGYELSQGVLDWGPEVRADRRSPGILRRVGTVDLGAFDDTRELTTTGPSTGGPSTTKAA